MTVRIVTDSCSDIPQEEAKRLGITMVPAYLRFGNEIYRDGVDIDSDEFYRKLATSQVHPSTAAPSPGDFAKVYEERDTKLALYELIWEIPIIKPFSEMEYN